MMLDEGDDDDANLLKEVDQLENRLRSEADAAGEDEDNMEAEYVDEFRLQQKFKHLKTQVEALEAEAAEVDGDKKPQKKRGSALQHAFVTLFLFFFFLVFSSLFSWIL